MPKFACKHCESKVRVPDKYVGKRVKCPGCGQAITVPGEEPGGGGLDLSLLDDSMSGGDARAHARKLRSIVIGCGACNKTVHIPENRVNALTPCPKCNTPLKVAVPPLPDTSGSTIDFKHLSLDPVGEPSLLGDSVAGGTIGGSLASLTSTGTGSGRHGSMSGTSGGSFTGNAQDQMQELRQLNDLKAEGSISDDEYRRRKAAVYGGTSASGDAARKAMSRSASGASEKAIRVGSDTVIPGPIKALAAVGVVLLAGFLVWQFGISPALNLEANRSTAESESADTDVAKASRTTTETAEVEPEPEPEPEVITWASRLPDVGPAAMEVALVVPGTPGPAPAPSVFDEEHEPDVATRDDQRADPRMASRPPAGPEPAKGEIAFWPVMLPDGGRIQMFREFTALTKTLSDTQYSATIGVGVGPAATGVEDVAFLKYQNDIRQSLVNTLANDSEYERSRPDFAKRLTRIDGKEYFEDEAIADNRTHRVMMLTGVQDGYSIVYWFAGPTRLYRQWQREGVGNAVIE